MEFILLQAQQQAAGNPLLTFLPFILILVVFYFFMIRPQQKRAKEDEAFRASLAKGDKVNTIGGIHGKVFAIEDKTIVLEMESGGRIRFDKSAIRPLGSDASAATSTETKA